MAAIDDIRSGLDINQLASMLGTDPATADQAVDQALGSLLGAMGGNVTDEGAALGLARAALGDHNTDLLDGGIDLGAIDTTDGDKILSHVYSADQIQRLSGAQGGLLQKLLPLLAPIVMAYIAKKLNGAMTGGGAPQRSGGGSILEDMLGSVLGGQAPQQAPQRPSSSGSGSILGDILGSVFGQEDAPAPAPQQRAPQQRAPQPGTDGPFRSPSGGTGDLRMDDGSGDAPAAQPTGGQPQMGGLGDLLRQILVGR